MKAFFVRAHHGNLTETFIQHGFVAIGWFGENKASDYHNYPLLEQHYKSVYPDHTPNQAGANLGQISRFWNEIEVGDIIVSTYRDGRLIIGKATSKAYFKIDEICYFPERINVEWKNGTFDRYLLPYPVQASIRATLTVFKIRYVNEVAALAGYEASITEAQKAHKAHLNYKAVINSIKEQLLQLNDREFEYLVSFLLQALGFDSENGQRHGKPGDGGIDFEGRLDVNGVTSINLQVQVKRYNNSPIREPEIRSLRGSAKGGYQLTFITLSSFHKSAIDSASDPQRLPVTLVDGDKLIALFIEFYEKVMELLEGAKESEDEKEMIELILNKLKFRRIIIPV